MMPKEMAFNNIGSGLTGVHDKTRSGIKKLADAVKITLGPSGRSVMYEREYGDPIITKDGVTVAKQVELDDPLENMAASMVRQAASQTAVVAGDGTTTATIYAEAIYEAGVKGITSGANPQEVKRGIDYATTKVVARLVELSKPVISIDQIKQVAICSANQDKHIGGIIADAMDKVGRDGVVTIEEGRTLDTVVTVVDGLQFPRGYSSPQFATNPETLLCEYDAPYILVTDQKIADLKLLLNLLEMSIRKLSNKPLVLIADDFSDDCLTALILNRVRAQLNIVAVKAPGYGDRRRPMLEDIAIATGAKLLSKDDVDVYKATPEHLGRCNKIKIDRDTTTILEGRGNEAEIAARVTLLRAQFEKMVGDFDKERVQERLARLVGGVAQISVGGATETEVREKKDRVEDALNACKAAVEEGILPGGGVIALHAIKNIEFEPTNDDFKIGINIVLKALEAPLRQIAVNTGQDSGVIIDKVKSATDLNFGFDALIKRYGDMIEFGIIVPTKVERVALQNAASIAGLLLTTDCMIAIKREQKKAADTPPFPTFQ